MKINIGPAMGVLSMLVSGLLVVLFVHLVVSWFA